MPLITDLILFSKGSSVMFTPIVFSPMLMVFWQSRWVCISAHIKLSWEGSPEERETQCMSETLAQTVHGENAVGQMKSVRSNNGYSRLRVRRTGTCVCFLSVEALLRLQSPCLNGISTMRLHACGISSAAQRRNCFFMSQRFLLNPHTRSYHSGQAY